MSTANAHAENEMAHSVRGFAPSDASQGAIGGQILEVPTHAAAEKDKVLPLPGWLVKLYFVFPVVLYVPDVIFNYYVYSDGVQPQNNIALQILGYVLWGFLSVGVVGMAYLLSVLAPWHWGQGHRIQAFFCGLGVVIATAITTWNSLSFRSEKFVSFKTDTWVNNLWPQLQANTISITMILVAIAPPFWGLFWAIVQPTETGRSLRQLQESHEERLLRMQQEAELKRLKAETNAKVREAQLRGIAVMAAAAREQARGLIASKQEIISATAAADVLEGTLAGSDVERTDGQATSPLSQHDVASITPKDADADMQQQKRQSRPGRARTRTRSKSTASNSKSAPVAATGDTLALVKSQTPVAQAARGADSGSTGRRSLSPTARDADLSHVRHPGDSIAGPEATHQY